MGFFYSLAHFYPRRYRKYRYFIWLAPVLAHGIYDAILMVGAEHELLSMLSYIPLVILCVWMHRFCLKRFAHAERLDEDTADIATFCAAVSQEQFLRTPHRPM